MIRINVVIEGSTEKSNEIYLTRMPSVNEFVVFNKTEFKVTKVIHYDKPNSSYYAGTITVANLNKLSKLKKIFYNV